MVVMEQCSPMGFADANALQLVDISIGAEAIAASLQINQAIINPLGGESAKQRGFGSSTQIQGEHLPQKAFQAIAELQAIA